MESRFIKTPSGTIHAQVDGAGETVVLIHGYSPEVNSWRTWDKNIGSLAAHFRVYALDLLGYGESDTTEQQPDTKTEARAVAQLLDAEEIARTSLVGLSWGGLVAQTVVGLVPERVQRLVLVDSAHEHGARGLERLKKIECPALIIWDEEDAVIPVENAWILGGAIARSQVRILKREERDAGTDPNNRHWSQVSHSLAWNRIVIDFLKGPAQIP
ncbi:MAG: alpha/beta fold hydrolase [Chloroflexi bacterium]|nr:alpha/beta fold hydrolase [Chloroflexota bacterium]